MGVDDKDETKLEQGREREGMMEGVPSPRGEI